MATKNPRLNVTFKQETVDLMTSLAQHEHKSLSCLVQELVIESLERREDMYFSTLADKRYAKETEVISHEEVWGKKK